MFPGELTDRTARRIEDTSATRNQAAGLAGRRLDTDAADIVASSMKDWAIEKGATHYAHVFYPLTGATAEKHDSFLSPDGDGAAIAEFSRGLHNPHDDITLVSVRVH